MFFGGRQSKQQQQQRPNNGSLHAPFSTNDPLFVPKAYTESRMSNSVPIPQHQQTHYDILSSSSQSPLFSPNTFGGLSDDTTWTSPHYGSPMWSFSPLHGEENLSDQPSQDMARHEQDIMRILEPNEHEQQQLSNKTPFLRSRSLRDTAAQHPPPVSRTRSTPMKSVALNEQRGNDRLFGNNFSFMSSSPIAGRETRNNSSRKTSRFQFSPPPSGPSSFQNLPVNMPQVGTSPAPQQNHHGQDHYLNKIASNSLNGRKTYKFRTNYLAWCQHYNVIPSTELIRTIKTSIRTQHPFQRLSICHAQVDDAHVRVLINTLLDISAPKKDEKLVESNDEKTGDEQYCDVNEILLNHNVITNRGAIELTREILDSRQGISSRIVSVELFGNRIGDESCAMISHMLGTNRTLRRLKLGDNNIGSGGAQILAEGLRINSTLTQLHLGGNHIQVEGLKSIAQALMDNTTLTSLGLRDNSVGADGMQHLAETLKRETCSLSDIQLKGNQIGADGAMHLACALQTNRSLKVLELQSNAIGPFGARALCNALRENRVVHALNFNENELGDEGTEAVAQLLQYNPSITTLGLANNRIRKRGASSLSRALEHSGTAVTGLDLGSNEIGNNGAVSLAKALKENNVMTSLDLRSCEIHLKGCLSLAEMAQYNTTLRHLDLGANYCKTQGAQVWAQVLRTNSTLTRLCLTDNQVYHEGGVALAAALQTNYSLRNFSYGGQGNKSNKIESTIRRVIDSIVAENKRHWERITAASANSIITSGGTSDADTDIVGNHANGDDEQDEEERPRSGRDDDYGDYDPVSTIIQSQQVLLPYESNNQYRFVDVSKLRESYNPMVDLLDTQQDTSNNISPIGHDGSVYTPQFNSTINEHNNSYDSASRLHHQQPSLSSQLPSWFTHSSINMSPLPLDYNQLDQRLEYLFKNNLLKAQNPKFAGCYFIGNVVNTLKKVFSECSRVDEFQLVQFAFNNPKYYVHLSREMVKTQIKYLGDQQQRHSSQRYQHNDQQQKTMRLHSTSLDSSYRPIIGGDNNSYYHHSTYQKQVSQSPTTIGNISAHQYPHQQSLSHSYGHFVHEPIQTKTYGSANDSGIIGVNNVSSSWNEQYRHEEEEDRHFPRI